MDQDDTVPVPSNADGDAPTVAAPPTAPPDATPVGLSPRNVARYALGDVIGRGGMGEVVSARDEQIGRSVAIKRMRAAAPHPETVARFLREARIQGRLEHPAVVPVHEVSLDATGQPFFVMKQLAGVTLAAVIEKRAGGDADVCARFPDQRLLRAFAEICLAIEFAHTRGVVHRDLKPANIVLGEFGEVYVLDWGIARVVADGPERRDSFIDIDTVDGDRTAVGATIGTPGYMSPEQVRGDADIDGRADVYALGCILFEILASSPLHPRGMPGLLSSTEGVDARPSLRAKGRDVPPELDAICVAATAGARDDRYATARELGDAVQRFLDGDRDTALRRQLAATELANARAALARGRGAEVRRDAIRAAGRALALDPTSKEPAELVARLMLEPPTEIPPDVEREMRSLDDTALRWQARIASFAMMTYLAFFPIMYWLGLRETWFVVGGPALVITVIAISMALARRPAPTLAYATVIANAVLIAMFARATSPFLIAPGLAAISAMVYAAHSRLARAWVLVASSVAAVLVPFFAEQAHVLSTTTSIVDNKFVLQASADHLQSAVTIPALVAYVIVIIALATFLSRSLSINRRDMQVQLQVQAWHLRQLVPTL